MFGVKYSRLKFWIISICLLIPISILNLFVKVFESRGDENSVLILYTVISIICLIWINTLSNRIREYGSNPWISLFALLPLINFLLAFYYGIAKSKNKPKESNNIIKNDTSLTKAVYNHSKDITSEIKPKVEEYKSKHSKLNNTSFYKVTDNINTLNEDGIYEKIMIEIEEDEKIKSTWAKALAQSNGDDKKAQAKYINMRFNILLDSETKDKQKTIIAEKKDIYKLNEVKNNKESISKTKNDKLNKYLQDRGMSLISKVSDNEVIACFYSSPIDCNLEFIDNEWIIPSEIEYKNYLNKINSPIKELNKNEKAFLKRYTHDIESPFIEINEYEIIIDSLKYGTKKYKRK